ncbi:MAG: hypothetical protein ABIK89_19970 [Planctomycetota bacterium]
MDQALNGYYREARVCVISKAMAKEGKKPAAADIPESATGKAKAALARPPYTALLLGIQPE